MSKPKLAKTGTRAKVNELYFNNIKIGVTNSNIGSLRPIKEFF